MLTAVRDYPEVETTKKDVFWEAQRDIELDDVEWGRFEECPVYRAAIYAIVEHRSSLSRKAGHVDQLKCFHWFWSPIV